MGGTILDAKPNLSPCPEMRTTEKPVVHYDRSIKHETEVVDEAGDQIRNVLVSHEEKTGFLSR